MTSNCALPNGDTGARRSASADCRLGSFLSRYAEQELTQPICFGFIGNFTKLMRNGANILLGRDALVSLASNQARDSTAASCQKLVWNDCPHIVRRHPGHGGCRFGVVGVIDVAMGGGMRHFCPKVRRAAAARTV